MALDAGIERAAAPCSWIGVPPGIDSLRLADGHEELHRALAAPVLPHMRSELERANYSALSVEVIDPFSNRIRFDENPQAKAT